MVTEGLQNRPVATGWFGVCFHIEFLVVLKSRATLKSKKAQRRTLNGDDRSSHPDLVAPEREPGRIK